MTFLVCGVLIGVAQLGRLLQRLADHVPTGRSQDVDALSPQRDSTSRHSAIHSQLDLQRVSEKELAEYKRLMEKDFSAHQVKPGDPDYEYDKQVTISWKW